MDELRTLLHALADRVAAGFESRAPAAADRTALLAALAAVADGDLSRAPLASLSNTPEGAHLTAAVARVRELVVAARAAKGAGTEKIDEVRAAAERASDAAGRQRVALERAGEQLRNLAQRSGELSTYASECGESADRAAMLSLNVGIEGLRVGGDVARALGALGEELRKNSQRGAAGARDLGESLRALGDQLRATAGVLDEARTAARTAGEEAARAAGAAEGARRADASLAEASGRFRMADDESDALAAELSAAAARIAAARERIASADPAARNALERALERVRASIEGT